MQRKRHLLPLRVPKTTRLRYIFVSRNFTAICPFLILFNFIRPDQTQKPNSNNPTFVPFESRTGFQSVNRNINYLSSNIMYIYEKDFFFHPWTVSPLLHDIMQSGERFAGTVLSIIASFIERTDGASRIPCAHRDGLSAERFRNRCDRHQHLRR